MVDPKEKKDKKMAHPAEPDMLADDSSVNLNYSENAAAKKLLDAIVSILAEEYIQKAKENPEVFTV